MSCGSRRSASRSELGTRAHRRRLDEPGRARRRGFGRACLGWPATAGGVIASSAVGGQRQHAPLVRREPPALTGHALTEPAAALGDFCAAGVMERDAVARTAPTSRPTAPASPHASASRPIRLGPCRTVLDRQAPPDGLDVVGSLLSPDADRRCARHPLLARRALRPRLVPGNAGLPPLTSPTAHALIVLVLPAASA
jgi:hypothetical protein